MPTEEGFSAGDKIGIGLGLVGLLGAAISLVGAGVQMIWPAYTWIGAFLIGAGIILFVVALFGGVLLTAYHYNWRGKGLTVKDCLLSPLQLTEIYGKKIHIQADALTKSYLGNRITVSGNLRNAITYKNLFGNTLVLHIKDKDRVFLIVYLDSKLYNDVAFVAQDTPITVRGIIDKIDAQGLTLSSGEIVSLNII